MTTITYKSLGVIEGTLEMGDSVAFHDTICKVVKLASSYSLINLKDGNRQNDNLGTLEAITKYCQVRGAVLVDLEIIATPFTGRR